MKHLNKLMILVLSIALVLTIGCKKDDSEPDPPSSDTEYATGWNGSDDPGTVPSSTNFGFGSDDLPSSYTLLDKFPPIGNQGNYGTCVAWAVGYNTKTMVNGLANGYGPGDLASTNKQFSPRDLFTAIDDNSKGQNCGGTNFNFAFDLVQNRGVATMATARFTLESSDIFKCYSCYSCCSV